MKKEKRAFYFSVALAFACIILPLNMAALNYTISFTGSGGSNTIDSIIVQNLTKGTTVTVPSGNDLNLTDVITDVYNPFITLDGVTIYPNPLREKSTLSFILNRSGIVNISISGLDGKNVIALNKNLVEGKNTFQLSLTKGVYLARVQGDGFSYSKKVISFGNLLIKKPEITFIGTTKQSDMKLKKSSNLITTLLYDTGDQLLYKGISSNYKTIVTDKPTGSKTTNFEFVECKDASGNNYAVVRIGTQTWMAENLKTTHYQDGSMIDNVTDNSLWANLTSGAWCDYSNLSENGKKYGHLYDYYVLRKKIEPISWHIPKEEEWRYLFDYVSANLEINQSMGKALASNSDWNNSNNSSSIGNNLTLNNSTGFGALPSGYCSKLHGFFNLGSTCLFFREPKVGESWGEGCGFSGSYNGLISVSGMSIGISIRCIKD